MTKRKPLCLCGSGKRNNKCCNKKEKPPIMTISRFMDLSNEEFWIPIKSIEGKKICLEMGMSNKHYQEGCDAGIVYNTKTNSFTQPDSFEIEGFE